MSTATLSSKDAAAFRQLPKLQESKQYKKALKVADGILKNTPDHGETISFKALTLNSLKKKAEAYELAKLGLMKTKMKSHVAWHAYGLIYRSDRNYAEAIKCYRRALTLSDSAQILRDLGILQIQSRDLKGYIETRKQLLALASQQRSNWIGFSLAHHMSGNYRIALLLLDTCLSNMKDNGARDRYEQSEIFMYKAMLMEEAGMLEGTLRVLEMFESRIVDKYALMEQRARILLRLGRFAEARPIFDALVQINPDCYDYHRGIQACVLSIKDVSKYIGCELPVQHVSLTPEQRTELTTWYKEQGARAPKVFSFKRIPLDFFQGQDLEEKADFFLRSGLHKGIPSLFSTLKPLYKAAYNASVDAPALASASVHSKSAVEAKEDALVRVAVVEKLVKSYIDALRATKRLPGAAADAEEEVPTVMLWSLFFWAQHLDAQGKHEDALVAIDEAIAHTPTLVDLFHAKARILKHAGDLVGAANVVEKGRELDLADKWINSKSAKFQLRADRITQGESVMSLFTKYEGDSREYLMDMQCMWFELEAGWAYQRAGNLALALKFFHNIEKHFDDFEDDQLDFHGYCLRKFTLRSYIDFLRMEDKIRGNKFFSEGAHGAITCYLRIFDESEKYGPEPVAEVPDYASMSAADRKKAKNAAKKAEQKKKKLEEAEAAKKAEAAKAAEEKEKEAKKSGKRVRNLPVDTDPTGEIFMKEVCGEPLERAHKIIQVLLKFASGNLRTHLDAFDVEVRRGKYLQAMRALVSAFRICGDVKHPELFWRLVPFLAFVAKGEIAFAPWAGLAANAETRNVSVSHPMELLPIFKKVIGAAASELGVELDSAAALVKTVYEKSTAVDCADVPRRISACKAMFALNPEDKSPLTSVVATPTSASYEHLCALKTFLVQYGAPTSSIEAFNAKLKEVYPRSFSPLEAENSSTLELEE